MQRYATLQQMQPQNAHGQLPKMPADPMQHYNPIAKGSHEAINAAKQSIQMDDRQSRRAMGVALMNLAANMGTPAPGTGLAGALGSVNQGMNPAVQAYIGEINQAEAMNHKLMIEQRAHEEQLRKEQFMERELGARLMRDVAEERHFREKMSQDKDYNRDYLNIQKQKYASEDYMPKKMELIEKGELPEDAVMLAEISDKKRREDMIKDNREWANKADPLRENLKSIDTVGKILADNPKMFNSYGRIIAATGDENPTVLNKILRDFSGKDLVDAQKIAHQTAIMKQNEYKASGGRLTDAQRKVINQMFDVSGATPDAAAAQVQNLRENISARYSKALNAKRGIKYGAYIPEGEPEVAKEEKRDDPDVSRIMSADPTISREAAEIAVRKMRGG